MAPEPTSQDHDGLLTLVLGAHRSGTSAVAGLLAAAGIDAGDGRDLIGRSAANPRGFVERPEVVALNDDLLKTLGWTWDSPQPEPTGTGNQPRREDVRRGRALMARSVAGDRPALIKDPRISLLLPTWRRILLDRLVAVVPFRPPAEVAWSLAVRDGLPVPLGLAIWAAYHRHLAEGLQGLPVVVVDYVALTDRPQSVVPPLLAALRGLGIGTDDDPGPAIATVRRRLRRDTAPPTAWAGLADGPFERLAREWSVDLVEASERFSRSSEPPEPWEAALLEVQRALRAQHSRATAAEGSLAVTQRELRSARARLARFEELVAAMPGGVAGVGRLRIRDVGRRSLLALSRLAAGWLLPDPLFDRTWYETTYPDVPRGPGAAWRHWRRHGWREGRDPNPLFDTDWYLERNPDVRAAGTHPLAHWSAFGAAGGRDPGPRFDTRRYLVDHPDVWAAGVDPLLHRLRTGPSVSTTGPMATGEGGRDDAPGTAAAPHGGGAGSRRAGDAGGDGRVDPADPAGA